MSTAHSIAVFCLSALLSSTAFAQTREADCQNEATVTGNGILSSANEATDHLKAAKSPFALWEALNATPVDVAAAKDALTEQNKRVSLAADALLKVVSFHQCLVLGPVAQFSGTFPLALEPWFDLSYFDKARETRLQAKYRAPNPTEEQEAVKRLTPIAGQLIVSGFNHMCRDDRTDAFFSRCISIQFKSNAYLARAKPLLDSLSHDYKNVVVMASGVIGVR